MKIKAVVTNSFIQFGEPDNKFLPQNWNDSLLAFFFEIREQMILKSDNYSDNILSCYKKFCKRLNIKYRLK